MPLQKLKSVLLIDDDSATRYLHATIIRDADSDLTITCVATAMAGSDHIVNAKPGGALIKSRVPDLIFLDVNMPILNGWDFLNIYRKCSDGP